MVKSLKQLFGAGPRVNYARLVREGALIVDVRSPREFSHGHIPGAINIPVEQLRHNFHQFSGKQQVIIACCTDGSKSWYAKNLLDANGYRSVYDAGSWTRLHRRLNYA